MAGQTHRLAQAQPRLDSAGIVAIAVVIENALHPGSAHGAVRAIGENGGIFDRDIDLVVKAVGDPAANLHWRRGAGIQQHVERVVNVVGAPLGA